MEYWWFETEQARQAWADMMSPRISEMTGENREADAAELRCSLLEVGAICSPTQPHEGWRSATVRSDA